MPIRSVETTLFAVKIQFLWSSHAARGNEKAHPHGRGPTLLNGEVLALSQMANDGA